MTKKIDNKKNKKIEKIKKIRDTNKYDNATYENAIELQISNNELLQDVINSVIKF